MWHTHSERIASNPTRLFFGTALAPVEPGWESSLSSCILDPKENEGKHSENTRKHLWCSASAHEGGAAGRAGCCRFADGRPPFRMLLRTHRTPTSSPPPPLDSDSLAEWTSLRFFGKRLNLTHFRPRPQGSSHNPVVDAIVIGDSYADDVDMGYRCWPSLLASRRGWSILNAS